MNGVSCYTVASKKLNHPLTRGELQFLDKALLEALPLVDGDSSPEGIAHRASDIATALIRERRLIRIKGVI